MNLLEKNPPIDVEAEKAVICSMIISSDAILKIVDLVSPDFFFIKFHKLLVNHLLQLYKKNVPIDMVTLGNSLKQDSSFKEDDHNSLLEIIDFIPTSANIEYYFSIVLDKFKLRILINICNDILKDVYQLKEEVSILIDRAEAKIFKLAQDKIVSEFVHIKPILSDSLDHISFLYNKKSSVTGISSGFLDLDKLTSGFQNSDLIIIAARPSMGKTALCLNISEYIGLYKNKEDNFEKGGVAFFSLEMSKEQVAQRLISSYSRINSQKIRTGQINKNDFPRLTSSVGQLMQAKIFIDDTPAITPLEIRAKTRRLLRKNKISIIIIDYLQLIKLSDNKFNYNRQNEIAEISRSLKTLAREFNKPVIVISQLSRSVEMRTGDHRPKLSDLRDSGAIEQDADLVVFIYRDEYYNQNNDESKGQAELIISKQRNGPTGIVKLAFNHDIARFNNFSRE